MKTITLILLSTIFLTSRQATIFNLTFDNVDSSKLVIDETSSYYPFLSLADVSIGKRTCSFAGRYSKSQAYYVNNLPTYKRTIMFWMNASSNSASGILGYGGSSCGDSFVLLMNNKVLDCDYSIEVQGRCGINRVYYCFSSSFANKWMHVAVVMRTTISELYIDGSIVSTGTSMTSTSVTKKVLVIGGIPDSVGNTPVDENELNFYNGLLDEIVILDRDLSAYEVVDYYKQTGSCGMRCLQLQKVTLGKNGDIDLKEEIEIKITFQLKNGSEAIYDCGIYLLDFENNSSKRLNYQIPCKPGEFVDFLFIERDIYNDDTRLIQIPCDLQNTVKIDVVISPDSATYSIENCAGSAKSISVCTDFGINGQLFSSNTQTCHSFEYSKSECQQTSRSESDTQLSIQYNIIDSYCEPTFPKSDIPTEVCSKNNYRPSPRYNDSTTNTPVNHQNRSTIYKFLYLVWLVIIIIT